HPLHLHLCIVISQDMQAVIHLPNKARSLIKLPLTQGTFREKAIDAIKRTIVSVYAKYKLHSVDPQFSEKEFLRDATKAYSLFLDSLANGNLQPIKKVTTCTLFRVNRVTLFKFITNRKTILKTVKCNMTSGDMNARPFGYSYAKVDTGLDVMNYFQIA